MFERIDYQAPAEKTPIGYVPTHDALDLQGLKIAPSAIEQLLSVDAALWRKEAKDLEKYMQQFGDKLPEGIREELSHLEQRLM